MSFVRLDNGEFPPLEKAGQQSQQVNKGSKSRSNENSKFCKDSFSASGNFSPQSNLTNQEEGYREQRGDTISNGNDFVRCRVGYQQNDYQEDLSKALKASHVGIRIDFILAPIEPIRPLYYTNNFDAVPDLTLTGDDWQSSVAINLGYPPLDYFDVQAARHFEQLFCHALYLSTSVIVIDCPESEVAYITVASTVNARLNDARDTPLVLFKVSSGGKRPYHQFAGWVNEDQDSMIAKNRSDSSQELSNNYSDHSSSSEEIEVEHVTFSESHDERPTIKKTTCPWRLWNSIRGHLNPDPRIGVCLVINDDLTEDEDRLEGWNGEPVRMVVLHSDQFVQSPGLNGTPKLNNRCKDFVTKLALANSLKISFVIEGLPKQDVKFHLQHLNYLVNTIRLQNEDHLRNWDDRMQPPLQPLSMNLDSGTYRVFEMDSMKYIKYKDAMIAALRNLIARRGSDDIKFILMVLGAGRGPLVDSFIDAIKAVNSDHKFKIYALDKNPSSVRSLKYKKKHQWAEYDGICETEVVEHDMRSWEPGVKADIIATELLGSLSDNELSPECIDGVWRFSTEKTISIPQDYSSYIGPICTYKLHQELFKLKHYESNVYDRIYVVKLKNCYHISEPQRLFKFEHTDLSLSPSERCNVRHTRLVFWSKTATVCHGFGGYFSANLFDQISLSTLPSTKTPNMDSWFPAFIPLEEPVQMPKDTKLEVHFWRKESSSKVWYEWVVTHPVGSRIYSIDGLGTAMSKFT